MNNDELRATELVLRSFGFSRAWVLKNDDPTEELFLVLPGELKAIDEREITLRPMGVLPGRKVWVSGHVPIDTETLF